MEQHDFQAERHNREISWLNTEKTPVAADPRRVPVDPASVVRCDATTRVLWGGRIFDGTGAEPYEGTVLINGNRIAAITPPDAKEWPADAEVIDVSGQTVLPGLIDLHTHLTYHEPDVQVAQAQSLSDATLRASERLRYYLECGITSVRDAGSHDDVPFRLKAWVSQHRVLGPRVFAAGCLITGVGGHGAEGLDAVSPKVGKIREASGPDDWRNAAREQFKKGADVIKIASHFSREEVAAVVDEAHSLGLKVMCDAETFYIQWAVEAGVDVIEHPLPRTDATIELMAEMNTEAVPTLVPYMIIFDQRGGYFNSTSRRFTFSKEDNLDVVRRMRRAGVKIGVGTDLVWDWFRYLPGAYIEELRQFVKAGFTNQEALVAATATGAEILDMAHELGTIEPGKLADITVVDGCPDISLEDLQNVRTVIRDGCTVIRDGRVFVPRHEPRSW